MKRNIMALAGLAVLLVAAGCKDEPMAGEFSVDLVTPNSDDGAIQFVASADAPETITGISVACSPCKLFLVKVSDAEYKGVLTGQISAGTLFRVGVSNKKVTKPYSVEISFVASRTYQLRSTTSNYSVTLKP